MQNSKEISDNSFPSLNNLSTGDSDPNHGFTTGEAALWKAVITQALMDAGSKSTKIEAAQDKRRAIQWLLGNSDDFVIVCLNANLAPEYVREKARIAIRRGCIWRNASAPAAPLSPPRGNDKKTGLGFPLHHKSCPAPLHYGLTANSATIH